MIDRGAAAHLPVAELQARVTAIRELMANVLEDEKDYGKIPGTDKPTLYKPGAEKLMLAFQLSAAKPTVEDLSTDDAIRYRVSVPIVAPDGRELAVGVGEASTDEEKYRWRKPVCDEEYEETSWSLRREKWFRGRDGKANWKAKQIRTSPADLANTVLKMAHKRAFIHATLLATAASSVFNQDLEDFAKELRDSLIEHDEQRKPEPKQPQRKSQTGGKSDTTKKPSVPDNAEFVIGLVEKVGQPDGKKYFAIRLKGDSRLFTTFSETVVKDAEAFVGTDHKVKLAYTVTEKDGRKYTNAVGIAIADAEVPPATTTAATTSKAEPQQQPLVADDIFGGAGREPGVEG